MIKRDMNAMNKKMLAGAVVGTVLLVGGAIAGTWAFMSRKASAPVATAPAATPDHYRYVGADQIVVMLRQPDEQNPAPMYREAHYAVLDVVLKVTPEQEPVVREHLLLLRSLTVGAVSRLTLEQVRRMNIAELADTLNAEYRQSYTKRKVVMPFEKAMISKLLAE
jgi:flagellar protein FliL